MHFPYKNFLDNLAFDFSFIIILTTLVPFKLFLQASISKNSGSQKVKIGIEH